MGNLKKVRTIASLCMSVCTNACCHMFVCQVTFIEGVPVQSLTNNSDNTQLFETRYLRHDLADFLDLTEPKIFHNFSLAIDCEKKKL